jgi:hypothetical protein
LTIARPMMTRRGADSRRRRVIALVVVLRSPRDGIDCRV